MKVNGELVPCVRNSSYSFIPILVVVTDVLTMLLRYACGLDIIFILFFITFSKIELCFSGIYSKKVHVVWIYVILRLYLCN